jgi:chromosomal replication initiator protein
MYFLRIEQGLALDEVGATIGGRDHTTIMHGVEKVTHLAASSVDIRDDISGIKKLLWG